MPNPPENGSPAEALPLSEQVKQAPEAKLGEPGQPFPARTRVVQSYNPDEPFGPNPFPECIQNKEWVDASSWTKEHLALFVAEMLDKQPAESANSEEHIRWSLDCAAGRFDIQAQGLARVT